MPTIFVCGDVLCSQVQEAEIVLSTVASNNEDVTIEYKKLIEDEWIEYLPTLKRTHQGSAFEARANEPFIVHSLYGYIGGVEELIKIVTKEYGYVDGRGSPEHGANKAGLSMKAWEHVFSTIGAENRSHAFFDLVINDEKVVAGKEEKFRLVFELFSDLCPKTCSNFMALCSGDQGKSGSGLNLCYKGTKIHRIVKNGWIQGGDISETSSGTTSESIFGGVFPDESFTGKHSSSGVLAMSSSGAHTNGSQFYITLKALPNLDGKRVVFGKVRVGDSVLKRINEVPTSMQRPLQSVAIVDSGVVSSSKTTPEHLL